MSDTLTTVPRRRSARDRGLLVGGTVSVLIFGVAFGNLLLGQPSRFDELLHPGDSGSFFTLLSPFALIVGMLGLSMLLLYVAVWLQWRRTDPVSSRTRTAATMAGLMMILAFAIAGLWLVSGMDGYRISARFGRAAETVTAERIPTHESTKRTP